MRNAATSSGRSFAATRLSEVGSSPGRHGSLLAGLDLQTVCNVLDTRRCLRHVADTILLVDAPHRSFDGNHPVGHLEVDVALFEYRIVVNHPVEIFVDVAVEVASRRIVEPFDGELVEHATTRPNDGIRNLFGA